MLKCNLFLATRLHSYTLSPSGVPAVTAQWFMIPTELCTFWKLMVKNMSGEAVFTHWACNVNPNLKKQSWISDNHSLSEQMRWHRGKVHIDLYCTFFLLSNQQDSKQPKFRKWIIPEVWKEKKKDGGGGQTHEEIYSCRQCLDKVQ